MKNIAIVKKPFKLNGVEYIVGAEVTPENIGNLWEPFLAHGRIVQGKTTKAISEPGPEDLPTTF